jgi:hypothetical protein
VIVRSERRRQRNNRTPARTILRKNSAASSLRSLTATDPKLSSLSASFCFRGNPHIFNGLCTLDLSLRFFLGALPLFSSVYGLFCKNTEVAYPLRQPRTATCSPYQWHLDFSRSLAVLLSTFRINTCKSVSKQRTSTIFRINTCEKTGGGGYHLPQSRILPPYIGKKKEPATARGLYICRSNIMSLIS